MKFRNFSNTYQFFRKSYRGFFEIYQENKQKWGLKIAFYVDVNVFSLSNLTILKADISKTSSERYRFLFIFVCRTSKYTHMQKIKIFYREVNYVHLALTFIDPGTSFFPQVLIKTAESKSGFRYYARSVAKHCDWNQAPGCQRETP